MRVQRLCFVFVYFKRPAKRPDAKSPLYGDGRPDVYGQQSAGGDHSGDCASFVLVGAKGGVISGAIGKLH